MSAKAKEHPCVAKMNDLLASRNARLKTVLTLRGTASPILVAIEPIEKRRRETLPHLAASFCPFCGKELP